MSLQELYHPDRTTEAAPPSRNVGKFDYLGPYSVPAWSDLNNVGKLCESCLDIPWADILEIHEEEMRTSWYSHDVRPSDFMERRRACAPSCVCSREFQDSDPVSFESSPKRAELSGDASIAIKSEEPDLYPAGHELAEFVDSPGHQGHMDPSVPTVVIESKAQILKGRVDTLKNDQLFKEYHSQWTSCKIENLCPETLQHYGLVWEFDHKDPKSILVGGDIDAQLLNELFEHTKALETAHDAPESPEKLTQEYRQNMSYSDPPASASMPEVIPNNIYYNRYGPARIDELILPPSQSGRLRSFMSGLCVGFWIQDDTPTVADVRESAHNGCHFCTLILNTWLLNRSIRSSQTKIRWANGPELGGKRYEKQQLSLQAKNGYLFGQAKISIPPQRKMRFGFNVLFESEQHRSKGSKTDELEVTDSAECIAKWWVENCLSNHRSTCGTAEPPVLPSRVIDVRGRGKDVTPFIFQSEGKRARYATLSYCWGKCVLLTTTTSNISQHSQGIPLSSMPKTFQDAITMTLALGLQYIWIDALCILQDSTEDCQRELGSMAQIYAESTVTIGAVNATSADGGFTLNRNKLAMLDCRVSEDIVISANLEGQEKKIESGTIHERAWCFQEVQISPRLLSCGGKELYFQCRRGTFREGSPLETYVDERGDEYLRLFDPIASSSEALYSRWLTAVENYTALNITFADDRLPAISGLAARFPSMFEIRSETPSVADYLSGMWRADTLRSLSWDADWRKDTESSLCNKYRAPSWSWGAVESGINFTLGPSWKAELDDQLVAEVLDAWTTPVSDLAPFGPVKAGKLVMYGPVTTLPQDVYNSVESDSEQESRSVASRRGRRRRPTRDSSTDVCIAHEYEEEPRTSLPTFEEQNESLSLTEESMAEQSTGRRHFGDRETILETDQDYENKEVVVVRDGVDRRTLEIYREVTTVGDYTTVTTFRTWKTTVPASEQETVIYRTRSIEISPARSEGSDVSRRRIRRRSSNNTNSKSREGSPLPSEDRYYKTRVERRQYGRERSVSREKGRATTSPDFGGVDSYAEINADAVDYYAQDSEEYRVSEKVSDDNSEDDRYTYIVRPAVIRTDSRYANSDEDSIPSSRASTRRRERSQDSDEDFEASSRIPIRRRQHSLDSYGSDEINNPSGINSSMVRWDSYNASRDINCVCLLLTPSWGLILSPVRKPGCVTTGGVYQRVGTFSDDGWKMRRRNEEYRDGHPEWEHRVVTIL